MLKMIILIGDNTSTHPPSIKIKFKSKLVSPLNSRRGPGERGAVSIGFKPDSWKEWAIGNQ